MSKECRLCGAEKPLSEFPLRPGSRDGHRSECRPCLNARSSGYWRAGQRNRSIAARFGIPVDEYERLLKESDGKCAICRQPPVEVNRSLSLDHDHETGAVRGLLCSQCNTALGLMKDDTERLLSAALYLERHRKKGE